MSNNYKSVSIAELIEKYCPINLTKEDYKSVTLREVDDDYRTKKLFFDPSYQRMYGSWDNDRKRKYIKSIFMKWIYTPIVLAELSKETAKKQPKGVKYACLDGQHRTHAIAEFVSNRFGLTGKVEIDDREKQFNNVLFKDLSAREREIFLRQTVEVQIINSQDISKTGQTLSKIFLAINDGEPLNSQEKRNAVRCDMSEWSRECYNSYKNFLAGKLFAQKHIDRMAAHEYFSKLYVFVKNFTISEATGKERRYITPNDAALNEIFVSSYRKNETVASFISDDLLGLMTDAANVEHNKHHLKKLHKKHLWLLTMMYSIMVLEEGSDLWDISEEFRGKYFWEFTRETFESLSMTSQRKQAELFTKFENEEITLEEYRKNIFFHEEIGRFHMPTAMKHVYVALREHLKGINVTESIRSWYSEKMRKALQIA